MIRGLRFTIKGGEGSGWYAPPKGTHTGGSAGGGITFLTSITHSTWSQWWGQIKNEWEGPRQKIAKGALSEIDTTSREPQDKDIFAVLEGDKLVAIATVASSEKSRGKESKPREFADLRYLATKRKGLGRQMMIKIVKQARNNKQGLKWRGAYKALGFYKKMGFTPKAGENEFQLSYEELGSWLKEQI